MSRLDSHRPLTARLHPRPAGSPYRAEPDRKPRTGQRVADVGRLWRESGSGRPRGPLEPHVVAPRRPVSPAARRRELRSARPAALPGAAHARGRPGSYRPRAARDHSTASTTTRASTCRTFRPISRASMRCCSPPGSARCTADAIPMTDGADAHYPNVTADAARCLAGVRDAEGRRDRRAELRQARHGRDRASHPAGPASPNRCSCSRR